MGGFSSRAGLALPVILVDVLVEVAVTALAEGVIQMMWLARPKPMVAVATVLVLAIAGVTVQGRQQSAPGGTQEQAKTPPPPTKTPPLPTAAAVPDMAPNQALARKQLAVIDKAWALMEFLAQNARIEIDGGTFGVWGRRRLEALRKAGAGKAEIVAALEKYIKDLDRLRAIVEGREAVARSTTPEDFEVQFLRMEAEIWLNEEKAR